MNKVQVRDKQFTISIHKEDIQKRVAEIATNINNDMKDKKPLFLAVLNGAFIFAADLLRDISIPCEISFVKMSSYLGTQSTGTIKHLIGLSEDIKDRDIIIVEDIIDSGKTMMELLSTIQEKEPRSIKIASLLVKPNNLEVDLQIDYCCFEIPNDFILGYGLDYDGEGRNLPDIYTVIK